MFDQALMFSDGQSIAQVAATYNSDKSIDTGVAGTPAIGGPLLHDWGRANDRLDIVGIITVAMTSGGAATVQISIVQADDAAVTTNVEVLRQTRAVAYTSFTLGKILNIGKVPSMTRRYLGLQYIIGAQTTTAGKIMAGLRKGVPSNESALLL